MMLKRLKQLLPWVLTILIFALLLQRIPIDRVLASLAGARWGFYLALMVPYSFAYLLIDTLAVTTAVRRFHAPVRYREILPIRAVTYVLALLNSNVGNGGLALWLHRRESVPFLAIAGTMLFLAWIEIFQLILYSSIGVALTGTEVPGLLSAFLVLYLLVGAWLVYFNGFPKLGLQRPAPGLLATFGRASLLDYLRLLAIKGPSLLLAITAHWVGLGLFGLQVPLVALLANLPLIFLVSAIPITVSKLGTSQAAWVYLLGGYAPGGEATLVAYSLAAHVLFLVMNALLGVGFLPSTGRELSELAARRDAETKNVGRSAGRSEPS